VAHSVYYLAISLDGFLAEADGTLGWLTGYEGPADMDPPPERGDSYERFIAGVGAIAMGGRTFRQVFHEWGESWPYGEIPSWVFTSRFEEPPDGVRVEFVERPVPEVFDEMAAAAGEKTIWVVGGANLADQFVAAGLLDEMVVTVAPLVLGDGLPFLTQRIDEAMLLRSAEPQPSGMVELRYRVR
jgi:dihydrofolate reductase